MFTLDPKLMTEKPTIYTYPELRHLRLDGTTDFTVRYKPEGWSKFYENSCIYELEDAKAHAEEMKAKCPERIFVVILVTEVHQPIIAI